MSSPAPPTPLIKVLIPLHPSFDTLDLTGPLEIFRQARTINETNNPSSTPATPLFTTTITAADPLTYSAQKLGVARDITFADAHQQLADFDILMVPGGAVPPVIKSGVPEPIALIKAFAELARNETGERKRTILSICTGSLFLAEAGVLAGRTATTHWGSMDILRGYAAADGNVGTVVEKRFVVNGVREGLRVVTSGGISCGMDAALWVVENVGGEVARKGVERQLEYRSRIEEGVVV